MLEVSLFRLHHGGVHQGTAAKPGTFDAVGVSDSSGYVSRFSLRGDELSMSLDKLALSPGSSMAWA